MPTQKGNSGPGSCSFNRILERLLNDHFIRVYNIWIVQTQADMYKHFREQNY